MTVSGWRSGRRARGCWRSRSTTMLPTYLHLNTVGRFALGDIITYENSHLLNESGRCTGHRDEVGYGLYLGSGVGLLLGVGSPGGFLCSSLFLPRWPPAWARLRPAWPVLS